MIKGFISFINAFIEGESKMLLHQALNPEISWLGSLVQSRLETNASNVRENIVSLGIMGDQFRVPLEPFNTIVASINTT